jgi:hypothetical protein
MTRDQIEDVSYDMALAANCLISHGMSWTTACALAPEVLREANRRESLAADRSD